MIGIVLLLGGVAATLYFTLRNSSGNAVTQMPDENIPDETPAVPASVPAPVSPVSLDARITNFARAISVAEGFGPAGNIPTRYHNPGDLKPPDGSGDYWSGQIGVGTGGHAIFNSDAAGFAALYKQIQLWQTGRSNVIFPSFTFKQAAQKYAENWQPWLANVTRELNVSPDDTLGAYFNGQI